MNFDVYSLFPAPEAETSQGDTLESHMKPKIGVASTETNKIRIGPKLCG